MRWLFGIIFVFCVSLSIASAQKKSDGAMRAEAYRLGGNIGLNFNNAGLGYQSLSGGSDFIEFVANDGIGLSPYIGIFGEYLSDSWWGFRLGLSYDPRNAVVYDETINPNSQFDLTASYFAIEPMLRIDPFSDSPFNFYIGPLLAFNLSNDFTYYPNKDGDPLIENQEIDGITGFTYGLSGGFAYDFLLNDERDNQKWLLSPFIDFSWMLNQREPNIPSADPEQDSFDDIWSTTTIRIGARLSWHDPMDDTGNNQANDVYQIIPPMKGNIRALEVDELFPIIPYVFFAEGSQDIPSRYIQLTKEEANDFEEENLSILQSLGTNAAKSRTEQQLQVYYQILNIFADRMKQNSDLQLTLLGSAPKANDGDILANKVKDYLVNVHGISSDRIKTDKSLQPRIPSGTPNTPAADVPLTAEENRRVEFIFNKDEGLGQVKIKIIDESSIDNDLLFVVNETIPMQSWNIVVTDSEGKTWAYGPYEEFVERINPIEIMADKEDGDFNANINIKKTDGTTLSQDQEFSLEKVTERYTGKRYSSLFDYAQSETKESYKITLGETIPKEIEEGNKIIVHGHTDKIGNDKNNRQLSVKRSQDAKTLLDDGFKKESKSINVTAFGFGEASTPSTFNNSLPEGRMYNRSVVVDVISLDPKK